MEEKKPIIVAQIMGKMVGGGVEAFVMNYYKNIDKSKIQFDFIIDSDSTFVPRKEIEELGGRIIEIPPYQHIFKYMKELIKLFKKEKYEIVHSNINALSVFPLFCAKMACVPVRIAHSHSTTNKKEWKKNLLKNILRPFSKVFATKYFACSEHAGRWLFGSKFFDSNKVKIINNAIDVQKFDYNIENRNKVRKELQIEDKFVIGHVGRFIPQKNHERIIDIFNNYYNKNPDSVLILIGDGILKNQTEQKVKELGIDNVVHFLGVRNDVNELFQGMDTFLFPSLYEGLGMVLIEAQCSGLQCIASTEVPMEAKITDDLNFINLNENDDVWCNAIKNIKYRQSKIESVIVSGYDIREESRKLADIYIDSLIK